MKLPHHELKEDEKVALLKKNITPKDLNEIFRKGYKQGMKDSKKICEDCATESYYVREAKKELLRDVKKMIKQEEFPCPCNNTECKEKVVYSNSLRSYLKELGEK